MFSSIQLLEQETATHGDDIYSLDGREWVRAVGTAWFMENGTSGNFLRINNSSTEFVEITGYFNDINMKFQTSTDSPDAIDVFVDGTENATTNISALKTTVSTPLHSRYVDASSLHNIGLQSTSLGIHTIKLVMQDTGHTAYTRFHGIELIAQDTSSDANKLKIQIPAQNVVSYGKKFAIPATAQHYDPFNGFTNGTDISGYIDEATSLGMSKWKISSTWYRPFNGGRVVKWIASDGTIKTSVTMMPPNAKSIANSASPTNAFATRTTASHYATNNPMNSFEAGTDLDVDGLSEVAKTFHYGEFGNGSANGGTSATNYADASMIKDSVGDAIGYVMDDGLTSVSSDGAERTTYSGACNAALRPANGDRYVHITFIGTGISFPETYGWLHSESANENVKSSKNVVQNLPYGTHVLELNRESSANDGYVKIDGVSVITNIQNPIFTEVTFHQPKMPPIPEDAVIISDYMLMADYVANATAGLSNISKGVRRVGASRDVFYDQASGSWSVINVTVSQAFHSPFTECYCKII